MQRVPKKHPLLRAIAVFTAIIALSIIALAPAYVASVTLTDRPVDPLGPSEIKTTNDVTDIDQNGDFKYSITPNSSASPVTESVTPAELIRGADLIKIEITEDVSFPNSFGHDTSVGCAFTLHLSSDEPFDAKTDSFVGYIKVTDEDSAEACATSLGDGFTLVSGAPANGS